VIAAHPEIERWAIGGHSLGGTMAASYADDHRATISGLVSIDGGNHAQFGDYGPQVGDNPATISRADQQTAAVSGTLGVLRMGE
jgi:pimeloyl-ACP methyl ester carboxylesterase